MPTFIFNIVFGAFNGLFIYQSHHLFIPLFIFWVVSFLRTSSLNTDTHNLMQGCFPVTTADL